MFLIGEKQVAFASALGLLPVPGMPRHVGVFFDVERKSHAPRVSCEFQAKRTWVMGFLWDFYGISWKS